MDAYSSVEDSALRQHNKPATDPLMTISDNRSRSVLQTKLRSSLNIQRKELSADMHIPVVQKAEGPDEEELPVQGRFETVQMEGGLEEEEPVQGKFDAIQKAAPEEEEPLQKKSVILQKENGLEEEEPLQKKSSQTNTTAQFAAEDKKVNNTGLPDNLKSGIENLSGLSLDNVNVHYNSDKPAQLQALAYTQGTDIHVAPGQEQHLPHEAWHVVQQMQGRVEPTINVNDNVPVNDNAGLENEADVMGSRAV